MTSNNKQMIHSTIKKLKEQFKLHDKDVLGGMLTSDAAKELYKNNIRIHHKHYIPKDKKKYFYEEEITGGKINLGKAFKKFGSTVKHTFQKVGNDTILGINKVNSGIESIGHKALDSIKHTTNRIGDYADTVMHGRNDYQPKVRELIKQFGEKHITSIKADRTPVRSAITTALNVVSLGAFEKRMDRTDYDKLFHLRIHLTFEGTSDRLTVEKNEVINMDKNPPISPNAEFKEISNIPQELTLNKLLEGGQKILGGKYFLYSAANNNCQDYIMALLKGSNIGSEEDYNFIKQDTSSLFKNDSFLRKMSNTVTDLGAKVNEITTGTGISYKNKTTNNEYNEMEGTGLRQEQNIIKKFEKLNDIIHQHQHIHGGSFNIGKAFKNLGSTIKKGFESKISHPIEHAIIKPTENIIHKVDEGGKKVVNKAGKYVTSKKGGLASDLLHKGVPMATGYLAGSMAETLMPYGGPLAGYAGNQAGKYAGTKLADYIGKETGVGLMKKPRGRPKKISGDLIHIDIGSHNAKHDIEGDGVKHKGRKTSLEQLIEAHRNKEGKELLDTMKTYYKDIKAEKHPPKEPKHSKPLGGGFKKGSQEAKDHMAKIRSMKKKH